MEKEKKKVGIVLNRMYTGSYLSTNLGHEVINMFQADNGKHYLYLNSKGNFGKIGEEVGTMLLVRSIGEGRVEVIGMAKNLQPVKSACCTLPRDLERINKRVQEGQKTFLTNDHNVKYGKVPILDIFGEKGQQSVYVSYWVKKDDFHTPISGTRLILEFPPTKKKDENEENQVYDNYHKKEEVEKIILEDSENNKETTIITIRLKNHNFASTSLHQFILEGGDLKLLEDNICNDEELWETKENKLELNECEKAISHEISLFDICQIQNDENKFSNALSYFILKYPELWRNFLKEIIKDLKEKKLEEIESVTREEDAKVNSDVFLEKTGGRIDLLIRTKNHYIIIENKIDSNIIETDGITQLERYYNYVKYLKSEECERLEKESEIVRKNLNKRKEQYKKLGNNKSGTRGKKWKEEIDELIKELYKIKTIKDKVNNREIIGLVLAPDYNMPNEGERKVKDDNYTFQELPYSKIYKWLKDNASKQLEYDSNFKAFHNAMKKHTFKYENDALYNDMKNKFFSRINEWTERKLEERGI